MGLGAILAVWMFALFFTALNYLESAFDRQFMPHWLAIVVALGPTVVYSACQAKRVFATKRVFRDGGRVSGKVTDLWLHQNGGSVLYEYDWQGMQHTGRHIFTSRWQFDALSDGQVIELVVDRGHPHRAFIKLFYQEASRPTQMARESNDKFRFGCGAYLAIGIVAMLLSGFVAAQIGSFLQPHVNDDMLVGRLGFIAAIDALVIVVICYPRSVEGAGSRKRLNPFLVTLKFMVLGMMCGHGHGLAGLFFWGGVNAGIGATVWFVLLGKVSPTEATQQ